MSELTRNEAQAILDELNEERPKRVEEVTTTADLIAVLAEEIAELRERAIVLEMAIGGTDMAGRDADGKYLWEKQAERVLSDAAAERVPA